MYTHSFIIDDDPTMIMLGESLLKQYFPNIEIQTFLNAELAQAALLKVPANANVFVLLDLHMNEMLGFDLIENLEDEDFERTRALTVCVNSSDYSRRVVEKIGSYPSVKTFIHKPLTAQKVKEFFDKDNNFKKRVELAKRPILKKLKSKLVASN